MNLLRNVLVGCLGAALVAVGGCSDGSAPEPPGFAQPSGEDGLATTKNMAVVAGAWSYGSQAHTNAVLRQRRIIINDDGNDVYAGSAPTSTASARSLFLEKRLKRILEQENQVDTIVYETTGGGFGGYFHPNTVGDFRNSDTWSCDDAAINMASCRVSSTACQAACPPNLYNYGHALNRSRGSVSGIDPLAEAIKYVHAEQANFPVPRRREVFWGIRMNDTHDAGTTANRDLFLISPFKKAEPANLFAAKLNPQGMLVQDTSVALSAGKWTSVRYENIAVRRFVQDSIKEVLEKTDDTGAFKYMVEGVQLNFMRHAVFFKRNGVGSAANATEIEKMTQMMRDIRAITNAAAEARGKEVLISVMVPDSVEYCLYLGIDLMAWYNEGLVDLVTGGDYMQLKRWQDSVALSAQTTNPVQFYAGFAGPRLEVSDDPPDLDLRWTSEAYRGRALEAWAEGVSGIQLSNPKWNKTNFEALYKQIGEKVTASGDPAQDPGNVSGYDLLQFGSFMGRGDNPGKIPNYTSYFSSYFRPAPQTSSTAAEVAAPDAPWSLPAGATKRWEFRLGRGNKQKNVNVYLRTLPLVGGQSSSLEVKIVSTAELGEESLDSRFYSSLPTELIDPDKFEAANGHPLPVQSGDAYRPMLLRLTLNDKARLAELLSVPTLKVDFINHSSSPIVIEDVFVHATQGTAVPNLITGVHSP